MPIGVRTYVKCNNYNLLDNDLLLQLRSFFPVKILNVITTKLSFLLYLAPSPEIPTLIILLFLYISGCI